jgi:hypothetical protein
VPARNLNFSPSGRAVAEAKASARRAYVRARKAGGLSTTVIDQLWAHTLVTCEGHEAAMQAEMLRRTEHLFVLLEDRGEWPGASAMAKGRR